MDLTPLTTAAQKVVVPPLAIPQIPIQSPYPEQVGGQSSPPAIPGTEGIPAEKEKKSKNDLSERHKNLRKGGRTLIDDSSKSEATLKEAMKDVLSFAESEVAALGGTIRYKTCMSLRECQEWFHRAGGPAPPAEGNANVQMRPDAGIIIATIDGKDYPIFIGEDKVQGTNDLRFKDGLPRQSLGNAIERAAKNTRGCEMLTAHMNAFPYVVLASGCDFHSSETISKRLEMMNMGVPNHYIEAGAGADNALERILPAVKVEKMMGHGIASVFVKAHKYDQMPHGSSRWTKPEIVAIARRVIGLTLKSIPRI